MIKLLIKDISLSKIACNEASIKNRRIQNWTSAMATKAAPDKGSFITNNLGKYSRSCSYIKWSYSPMYMSFVEISDCGKKLDYSYGFKNEETFKTVLAPKGTIFQSDLFGLVVKRLSDGMDYHPSAEDLKSKRFISIVREKMADNYNARLLQKREVKKNKLLDKLFLKDLNNTMVTLNDSRKAGNCVEGSLSFAEKYLKIPRQDILNGGHLFKVRASKLVKTGDNRAINAARIAWQRETTICI